MRAANSLKRLGALIICAAVAIGTISYSSSIVITADTQQSKLEDQLKKNQEKQKEIEAAIKDIKGDISKEKEYQQKIDEDIAATEEYIRTLTDLIKEYDKQIDGLNIDISNREADIANTQKSIDAQRDEINKNIRLYEKQLRAMYISGSDSTASILLGATDFFDMLMKLELVKRVAKNDDDLITHLLEIKTGYENDKLELENKIADLEFSIDELEAKIADVEALRSDWDAQLEDLNALYKESKSAMKMLKDKEESYEENREELEKEAEKIEEEIQRIIREASRKEYMGDLPQGTFLWPVPGYYQITSGYGGRWGTTHRGIDISGSGIKGANITAANSGVVITVYNGCSHNYGKKKSCGCGGGFGNYCIIDHGGGYATLYGHATKITAKEGQHVTTGDVIGTIGSTGYSTGYHLHFEVRVDGERKDPEKFNLIKK